jgi:hypothetical protein
MLRVLSLASLLLVIAMTPATLRSFAEGPFPGFTGGFGEPTCQQCHFGNDLNAAGGTLTLTGVPAVYQPGKSYALTVSLSRTGLEKGGFQMAARSASGAKSGSDAGTLEPMSPAVQLVKSEDGNITYVQHTPAGTKAEKPGTMSWKFRWTAPTSARPVSFDLAANATNNDESPMDDFIYTASVTARPGSQ